VIKKAILYLALAICVSAPLVGPLVRGARQDIGSIFYTYYALLIVAIFIVLIDTTKTAIRVRKTRAEIKALEAKAEENEEFNRCMEQMFKEIALEAVFRTDGTCFDLTRDINENTKRGDA